MEKNITEENLKRICRDFSLFIPYFIYENGTFAEQSEVFPQKMDEEGFLTLSSEPERKRLNLAAVIFKSFCNDKNKNVELFPQIDDIHNSEDLDELAYNVVNLMSSVLEPIGIEVLDYSTLDYYDDCGDDSSDSLLYMYNPTYGEGDDFILLKEKMAGYGITFKEPIIVDEIDYASADNQILIFIKRPKLKEQEISYLSDYFLLNELMADYFNRNCLITNCYNDKGEEGVLLIYEWGCPRDYYYHNTAPFASIDFFRLCYMLLFVKAFAM